MATCGDANMISIWNPSYKKKIYKLENGHSLITLNVKEYDFNTLISGSEEIWNLPTSLIQGTFTQHTNYVIGMYKMQNKQIASGDNSGNLFIWDIKKSDCPLISQKFDKIHCILQLSDERLVISNYGGNIYFFDPKSSEREQIDFEAVENFWSDTLIQFYNGDFFLPTKSNKITIFDILMKKIKNEIGGHSDSIISAAYYSADMLF